MVFNIVSKDIRTTMGDNLPLIEGVTGLDMLNTTGRMVRENKKTTMKKVPIGADCWRVQYLEKLLSKQGERYHQMEDTTNITEIINCLT